MSKTRVPMVCNRLVEDERLKQLTFAIIYHRDTGYLFYDESTKPEYQRLLVDEAKKIFPDHKVEVYALPEFVIIRLITEPSFVQLAKRFDEERNDEEK